MNLKQLLKQAGISNDIAKEVERKAKKTSAQMEQEHQERALAMTKMMLNDALRYRKEHGEDKKAAEQVRTIILPNEK
jgi:glycerol dehydrogenase-like iron-containing ADH family enzyme